MPRPSSSTVTEPSTLIETLTIGGVAGHRFVDRVVDDFVDEVVQAAGGGVADVHGGPLADVLQVAEVLEVLGGVGFAAARRAGFWLFVFVFVGHVIVSACRFALIHHRGHGEHRE